MAARVSGSEDVIFISDTHFLKKKHLLGPKVLLGELRMGQAVVANL